MTSTEEPQIIALPDLLINQIAAGEVVERPANVIKELVENSLDAFATRIEVEVFEGGLEKMVIRDDGMGMSPTNLARACQRHSTSKLSEFEDLESLTTFGFRGEALSSISAVSRLTLRSRRAGSPHGYEMTIHHGQLATPPTPQAMAPGTQVTIEHLFETLPARKKFLRSSMTEYAYIQKTLLSLALAHPEVSFVFKSQNQTRLQLRASSEAERIFQALKLTHPPRVVSDRVEGMELELFLSFSTLQKKNARTSSFYQPATG